MSRSHEFGPEPEEMISVRQSARGDLVIVTVEGEVDMATSEVFKAAVDAALKDAGSDPMVLDLTGVSFLGSHGLTVLVDTQYAALPSQVRVVVDSQRPVVRPIQVAGIAEVLTLFHSVEDAVAGHPTLDG